MILIENGDYIMLYIDDKKSQLIPTNESLQTYYILDGEGELK